MTTGAFTPYRHVSKVGEIDPSILILSTSVFATKERNSKIGSSHSDVLVGQVSEEGRNE
jgi:hypothetical protein